MRGPILWFGGKGHMVRNILPLIPVHEGYSEPFFGGGSIFFGKEPSKNEIINDINAGAMNFYRILRDRCEEFVERCRLSELGEYLWDDCRKTWEDEPDDFLRAWKWYVVARQSFAGKFASAHGHSRATIVKNTPCTTNNWCMAIERLPEISKRLKNTEVLCGDWREAMRASDKWLCYLDPPYVPETRRSGVYPDEMTTEDHEVLVDILLNTEGMFLLSGYPSKIYEPLTQNGWEIRLFNMSCSAAGRVRHTGLFGTGAAKEKHPRTECVWISPLAKEKAKQGLII